MKVISGWTNCKSRNGRSGDGMRGMMGTWGIRVGMMGECGESGGEWWESGESGGECGELGVGMRGIRVTIFV